MKTVLKPGQPEFNRATQVSLKDDTKNKSFSIGLEDIDNAMVFYLENVIKPTVTLNKRQIEVPVEYFETQYSRNNIYDNFNVLRDQKVEKSYILGVIPDYIDLNYTLSVFTDYTTQANEIVEAIEFAARSYWGDPERFLFRANIDTFNTPILLESGSDRANRSTMNVVVNGYLIPTGINAAMAGPNPKSYSVTRTVFKETVVE